MINKNTKIFVAGHNGLVGSAILRKLKKLGYKKLIIPNGINTSEFESNKNIEILKATNINQALIYALNNI